jgi:hypothetical protein
MLVVEGLADSKNGAHGRGNGVLDKFRGKNAISARGGK